MGAENLYLLVSMSLDVNNGNVLAGTASGNVRSAYASDGGPFQMSFRITHDPTLGGQSDPQVRRCLLPMPND